MTACAILKPGAVQVDDPMVETAQAYDGAGIHYRAYADGMACDLFDFGGSYAYGDRRTWAVIDTRLVALAAAGHDSISVLDAGCGPGTWLLRVVKRAHALGISRVKARGFDISGEQIAIARAQDRRAGIKARFEHGDLTEPLPEADGEIDLCLCLNGVLNHLPVDRQAAAAADLARVTGGHLIVTVRAVGSMPSIFIEGLESVATFRQDNDADRLSIDIRDGRRVEFGSHLFRARELESLFAPHIVVSNLTGLDLFHSRFLPDPRWNPAEGAEADGFHADLELMERTYGSDPHFIDHATHLLIVGEPERIMEG